MKFKHNARDQQEGICGIFQYKHSTFVLKSFSENVHFFLNHPRKGGDGGLKQCSTKGSHSHLHMKTDAKMCTDAPICIQNAHLYKINMAKHRLDPPYTRTSRHGPSEKYTHTHIPIQKETNVHESTHPNILPREQSHRQCVGVMAQERGPCPPFNENFFHCRLLPSTKAECRPHDINYYLFKINGVSALNRILMCLWRVSVSQSCMHIFQS